ncbi:MAG: hypothetical protein OEY54_05485 [Nitrosopumilus sp.]|nr:hypothetical protein [Nitrosopumilus sp.]
MRNYAVTGFVRHVIARVIARHITNCTVHISNLTPRRYCQEN